MVLPPVGWLVVGFEVHCRTPGGSPTTAAKAVAYRQYGNSEGDLGWTPADAGNRGGLGMLQ
jgi:hypothetical protein